MAAWLLLAQAADKSSLDTSSTSSSLPPVLTGWADVLTGSTDAARASDVSELTGFAEGEGCEATRGESRSSASAFGADCKLFAVAFCFRKASNYRKNSLFSYKSSKDTDYSGIAVPSSHLATPSLLQFLLGARTAHRGFNRAGVKVSPQMLQ